MVDRCGVCNGDGTSCLGCEDTNIQQTQVTMDSTSLAQKKLVFRAARELERSASTSDRRTRKYVQSLRVRAQQLYESSWGLTWSIPTIITSCSNTEFCVQVSNTGTISQFNNNSQALKKLAAGAAKRLKRLSSAKARSAKSITSKAAKLHDANLSESAKVPANISACS